MARLEAKTILAQEVVAARESPALLEELLKRADPYLYRTAKKHHRYHPWDEVDDIYQKYRESFLRCIYEYDVSRSFDGMGFITFLNWKIRTDYRSHYRKIEAAMEYQLPMRDDMEIPESPDLEDLFNRVLELLSAKDQTTYIRFLAGETENMRNICRIQRKIRTLMEENACYD